MARNTRLSEADFESLPLAVQRKVRLLSVFFPLPFITIIIQTQAPCTTSRGRKLKARILVTSFDADHVYGALTEVRAVAECLSEPVRVTTISIAP